jgi:hypothetical protein
MQLFPAVFIGHMCLVMLTAADWGVLLLGDAPAAELLRHLRWPQHSAGQGGAPCSSRSAPAAHEKALLCVTIDSAWGFLKHSSRQAQCSGPAASILSSGQSTWQDSRLPSPADWLSSVYQSMQALSMHPQCNGPSPHSSSTHLSSTCAPPKIPFVPQA